MSLIDGFDREVEAGDIHISSPSGDMTSTLHDVAVLLGLRINNPVVTGSDDRDLVGECERLLGSRPRLRLLMVEH